MRIGRTFILLFLSALICVSVSAQDQQLGKGINAQRIYNTDEGPETIIVAAAPAGSNMKLHLFLCNSVTEFDYVKQLTSKARAKMVDVYWNADAERYVITWLAKKATLYFALLDPVTSKVDTEKVKLKSADIGTSKQLRSAHTTYNPDRNVYTACVSDGPTTAFLDIDADTFGIVRSKISEWSRGSDAVNVIFGDIVYSDAFDKYYGVMADVTNEDLFTVFFNNVEDSSYKSRGGEPYYTNSAPPVELCIFPSSTKRDDIFFAYLDEDPVDSIFDVKTNRISKSGRPGKAYWEYDTFSDAFFGLGGVDHAERKMHYIAYDESYLFPDYEFRPAFRLYSVKHDGRRANGPKGELARSAPAGVTRTGAAVVDENIVVFYTKSNKTYYFPLSYGAGTSIFYIDSVTIKGNRTMNVPLPGLNVEGFAVEFEVRNVNIAKINRGVLVGLYNANGSLSDYGGRSNGGRFTIQARGTNTSNPIHARKIGVELATDSDHDGYLDDAPDNEPQDEYTEEKGGNFDWSGTNKIRVEIEWIQSQSRTRTRVYVNDQLIFTFFNHHKYYNPAPRFTVGNFFNHEAYDSPVGATISNLVVTNLK